jgi:hypothetical protein
LQKTLTSTTPTPLQTIQIELAKKVKAAYDAFKAARLALDAAMGTLQAAATTAGSSFVNAVTGTTGPVDAELTTFVGTYGSKDAITTPITVLRDQYTELNKLINLNSSGTPRPTAVTIGAGLKTILGNTGLDDAAIVEFAKLYYQMDASLNTVTTNTLAEFDTAVDTSLSTAATATPDATNILNIKGYFKDDADVGLPTSITDAHKATLDVLSKLVQVKSTAGTILDFPDKLTITAATTYKPAKDLLTNLEKVMAASTAAASTATASTAAASTVVKKQGFTMAYLTLKLSSSKITITPKEDTNFTTFIDATKKIPILLFDPERPKADRQAGIDSLMKEIGNEIKIRPDGYPVTEQLFKLSELREKVLGVK